MSISRVGTTCSENDSARNDAPTLSGPLLDCDGGANIPHKNNVRACVSAARKILGVAGT